jgi:predicted GIY-YIG superfamily endonuclease
MDPPRQLLAAKAFASKREALQVELKVKQMKPLLKRALANEWAADQATGAIETSSSEPGHD